MRGPIGVARVFALPARRATGSHDAAAAYPDMGRSRTASQPPTWELGSQTACSSRPDSLVVVTTGTGAAQLPGTVLRRRQERVARRTRGLRAVLSQLFSAFWGKNDAE